MTEIAFYHLERSNLDKVLPVLLGKTLGLGKRALVVAGSEERVEHLAAVLWTFDPDSWLPHGTHKDGSPEDQPVWLTDLRDSNLNGATFLFMADGMGSDDPGAYERCFDLFDGQDEEAVQAARLRWKAWKDAGFTLTYWQQTPMGRWEKKASTEKSET